jgi:hypothetical protein
VDLDDLVALYVRGRDLLVGEGHVLAVGNLEALDDLVVGHLVPGIGDLAVVDALRVAGLEQVEVHVVLADRRVHADGRIDEAERDGATPECTGHGG